MPEEVCLTYRQVMARTGLKKSSVYKLLETGHLTGYRPDGLGTKRKPAVFFESGVESYMERGRVRPAPPEFLHPSPPPRRRPCDPTGGGRKYL